MGLGISQHTTRSDLHTTNIYGAGYAQRDGWVHKHHRTHRGAAGSQIHRVDASEQLLSLRGAAAGPCPVFKSIKVWQRRHKVTDGDA